MKGDFTRVTFSPEKHYDGVRMQQGRVQLDADFNEQAEIREFRETATGTDVIGLCGVPKRGGGFAIGVTSDGRDLTVSPGRIYVDGILCENADVSVAVTAVSESDSTATVERLETGGRRLRQGMVVELLDGTTAMGTASVTGIDEATREVTLRGPKTAPFLEGTRDRRLRLATTYSDQPHLPVPETLEPPTGGARTDLVYLDVWQRHVTAVEDPELLEQALGGVDTSTRVQTVWQVRVLPGVGNVGCEDEVAGWPPAPTGGRLTNDTVPGDPDDNPCVVPAAGGYTGIENRFYRIEVHQPTETGRTETFKWSRDNGSLAFPIDAFVNGGGPATEIRLHRLGRDETLGLRVDDWVEYLDDSTELAGVPGKLVQIESIDELDRVVTLSEAVGPADASLHPKLRRWDQPSDALQIADGVRVPLEAGIEIEFGGDDFRAGDYWTFAARTASGEIERLDGAPPNGIRHHYCRLALVTWEERSTTEGSTTSACVLGSVPADCRIEFPPLTEICAEDVCFDNTICGLTDVDTVQDVLDKVCADHDLRFHKRHLHGWGIVCGLQVHCDGSSCDTVTVRDGYAIDCDGRDIVLRRDEQVNVLKLIRAAGANGSSTHRSHADEGNGAVLDGAYSLYLGLDDDLQHTFGIEPYERAKAPFRGLLEGTLLWDVWEDCVQPLVDFYEDQFTLPDDDETSTELVSPAQKRLTTFLNLIIQLVASDGRYVFLSRREHDILHAFYSKLRALLQSKTFCAMFKGAREFPDYPEDWDPMPTTAFGRSLHSRLRLDPKGERAFTCGHGNEIQVFDLATDELVEVLTFPAGPDVQVRDVATFGGDIYAIGVEDGNTFFAVADYDGSKPLGSRHSWRSMKVTCSIELLSLGVSESIPDTVFAVGDTWLWSIKPDDASPAFAHVGTSFAGTAAGPLALVEEKADGRKASAYTLVAENVATGYDTLVRIPLGGGTANQERIPLTDMRTSPEVALTGEDDLAVAFDKNLDTVAVVVNAPAGGEKWVLLFDVRAGALDVATVVEGLDDTETRLAYDADSGYVLASSADSFRLTPIDLEGALYADSAGNPYRHPVQIGPMSIAASVGGRRVYALNQASRTISSIVAADVPSKPDFDVEALAAYRNEVLGAFTDLVGGFLQYIKDCVCDHLLVECPTCTGDEKLYLAAIEIEDGDVYHVCNFSKRRYVKSFPTVEYWLSAVPVLPLLHLVIERICCAVLPRRFGKYSPSGWGASRKAPISVGRAVHGVSRVQSAAPRMMRGTRSKIGGGGQMGLAWVESRLFGDVDSSDIPPEPDTVDDAPDATIETASTAEPAAEPAMDVAAELAALRTELEDVRGRQERGFAARDKKIATLRKTVEGLRSR